MRWVTRNILRWIIRQADSSELNEMARAIQNRYKEVFPQEEVIFLSMPKDDREERQRILGAVLALELEHGKK